MDDNLTNEALLFALELAQFRRNHRRVVGDSDHQLSREDASFTHNI
jgi:hypothetical protein